MKRWNTKKLIFPIDLSESYGKCLARVLAE